MTTAVRQGPGSALVRALRAAASPLSGAPGDHDRLIEAVGSSRIVLLGEASHGTHEFYRQRAVITKRLIEERGFRAVAVEADWPDAYRVNRWVHGADEDADAEQALRGFERFPTWMWRNADVLDFVGWLRAYREASGRQVSFFGLDLYSLYRSIASVIEHLERVDPKQAEAARSRYACFDRFERSQDYGYAVMSGLTPACREDVGAQLIELQRLGDAYLRRDGIAAEDEQFHAEQNARLVVEAERYYRAMFSGRHELSWNLRDRHMADALQRLLAHLDRHGGEPAKVVVWAHNSHVGDARKTEMQQRGELNLGQLTREGFGADAALIGFSNYEGTVTAASEWDGPAKRMRVRPGLPGSYEELLHQTGIPNLMLDLDRAGTVHELLAEPRLQRAIGVIYRPETERSSHYFYTRLAEQFDVVLHFDRTRAVEPLERSAEWDHSEPPETYPSAL
jgi:erythromycin esterase-like protein